MYIFPKYINTTAQSILCYSYVCDFRVCHLVLETQFEDSSLEETIYPTVSIPCLPVDS